LAYTKNTGICTTSPFSAVLSTKPIEEIRWDERIQNKLFCVEWDIKPQLYQSTFSVVTDAEHGFVGSPSAFFTYLFSDTSGQGLHMPLTLPITQLSKKYDISDNNNNSSFRSGFSTAN